jgi:hypothetical protein
MSQDVKKEVNNKPLSLSDLNLVEDCNSPFEFELLDGNSDGTGVLLSVVGDHADVVTKWKSQEINRMRRQDAHKKKKGKDVDFRTYEDDMEFGHEFAAIKIVNWSGISEPFSKENALLLCEINELAVIQINEASSEMGNFTDSK